jgi:hypothetical protein
MNTQVIMNDSRSFAYYFLYRCLGIKKGSKINASLLYERYIYIYSQIQKSDYKTVRKELGPYQFYKIIKSILEEISTVDKNDFELKTTRSSKGLMVTNIYLDEHILIQETPCKIDCCDLFLNEMNLDKLSIKYSQFNFLKTNDVKLETIL